MQVCEPTAMQHACCSKWGFVQVQFCTVANVSAGSEHLVSAARLYLVVKQWKAAQLVQAVG